MIESRSQGKVHQRYIVLQEKDRTGFESTFCHPVTCSLNKNEELMANQMDQLYADGWVPQ